MVHDALAEDLVEVVEIILEFLDQFVEFVVA